MAYRSHLKPNPFEATKRNIDNKLYKIEETILQKFAQGNQRELMRRTIRELLVIQQTTQGKIKRLINILDNCEFNNLHTDCTENQLQQSNYSFQLNSPTNQRQITDMRSYHSPVASHSSKLQRSFDDQRLFTQNQEEDSRQSEISYPYSHNSPFSGFSSNKALTQNLNHTYQGPNKSETPLHLYDSINEKDIFSFRTQKDEHSPLAKKNKEKTPTKEKKISSRSQQKSQSKSQSRSQSKSQQIVYSQKSSLSRSKKSKSKKKLNYDGISESYDSKVVKNSQKISKSPKNSKPIQYNPANMGLIYKKIANRLKYSSCIINKIDHSNNSSNIFHIQNRFKQQSELRASFIRGLHHQITQKSIWK